MSIPPVWPLLLAVLPIAAVITGLAVWSSYRRTKVWSWTYAAASLITNTAYFAFLTAAFALLGMSWFLVVVAGAVASVVASRTRPWPGKVTVTYAKAKNWTEDDLP